jgi:O-antigen/teichoic acid export membrane protein
MSELGRLGAPQAAAIVAVFGSEFVHRVLLAASRDDAGVGQLGLGVRLAAVLLWIVVGLQSAWHPRVFTMLTEPDGLRRINVDGRRIVVLSSLIALLLALATPDVIRVIGGVEYEPAVAVTGLLLTGAVGTSLFHVVSVYVHVERRFGHLSISTVSGSVLGVLFAVALGAELSPLTSALALTIGQWSSMVLMSCLMLTRTRRVIRGLPRLLLAGLPAAVGCVALTTVVNGLPARLGVFCAAAFLTIGSVGDDVVVRRALRGLSRSPAD